MSRRVLLLPAPPHLRGTEGVPEHATFVVLLDVDGQIERIIGTDDAVPAGVHPEKFAENCATAADAQYATSRWLRFTQVQGRWLAIDTRACRRHGLRDCECCTEGHTDPLDFAGDAQWIDFTPLARPRRASA